MTSHDEPRRATTSHDAPPADWRDETLSRIRALIREADPEVIEERKWQKPSNGVAGVPVWSRDGIVCTGETYESIVKLLNGSSRRAASPERGRP